MKRMQLGVACAAACFALMLLSGCHSSNAAVSVQILPGTSISIDEGQSTNFTASVTNDIHNQGVTWSLVQTASTVCSGSGCGTLSNATNTSVTYTAPPNLTAGESITLTATALVNSNTTAKATISVVLAPMFSTTAFPTGTTNGAPYTLPNGANGVPYNETISVTGGVSPVTFSLKSGSSLPAGLSINSSGSIVGKPSIPSVGQSTLTTSFTVLATDNGMPPLSVPQVFTMSVTPPPQLSLITGSLPGGLSNSKYTALVATTGGVSPLSWTVVSGSSNLASLALALSPTSGQITGTIPSTATAGVYSFTVQAQDSTLPTGQTVQKALSINVQQPAPVGISTTTLSSGTTGTAYNGTLQATGGIPPYTWTVTSGQLPSGLTLATSGTISGVPVLVTPTTGDNFTVRVQDSEASPVAASQTLNISILAGSGSNNSVITGSYSFLFNGFDSGGPVAIAGSITTDGNGNITSGAEDSNRISSGTPPQVQAVLNAPLTGSYKLNSDGTGSMQLIATNPKSGVTLTTDYVIVLDSSGTIHFIENNDITTNTGTDTFGTHGEGIMKPVLGTGSLNGNYSFLFSGQDLSGKQAALAGAINANGINTITTAAGGVSTDFNDNGTLTSQNISGFFSVGSSNGRGTATFLLGSGIQIQFAFYFVSSSDLYFIEIDQTTGQSQVFYRLSGEMVLQTTGYAFVNTSLSGASVVTGTGLSGNNANVFAGLFTGTAALPAGGASGTATVTYDENNGGAITNPSPSFPSGAYSVTPNGRVTFTGLGSRLAVAYLTGPGQGFVLGNDAAVTTGLLEQQATGIAFSLTTVEGGYTLSTSLPGETKVPNLLGQVNADGLGGILGTADEVDPPTTATPEGSSQLNVSLNAHINFVAANGRGTAITTSTPTGLPGSLAFYILSPAHFRAISLDSNPGNAHPDVLFFDH